MRKSVRFSPSTAARLLSVERLGRRILALRLLRSTASVTGVCASLLDRLERSAITSLRGFRAEIAFAVDAEADGVGFHVAVADDEHGVDFHLLGVGDLRLHVIAAGV